MLSILQLSLKRKEVQRVSFDKWSIGNTLTWVDCFKPTTKELEQISSKTKISTHDLKETISINKRPHVIPYKNYSLVIFHGFYNINENKTNEILNVAPVSIILFKNDIITIHDKPVRGIDDFRNLDRKQVLEIFRKGAPYFIYRFMDCIIENFFELADKIGDDMNKTEKMVVKEPKEAVTRNIFTLKRKLIYINKSLIANREVVASLEKRYLKEFKEEHLGLLRTLYYDIAQLIDLVGTYRDISTSILDMYLSMISNSLNKVMKILTVLSAFVLIPTMISGIYGMNFQKVSPFNMPELYWIYGYPFALGLMLISMFVIYFWFRRKGWL